jgi:hypothetical protein
MVRVRAGNVTRVDTAYVSVTDVAYQPASLQLTTPYGAAGWILFGQVTIAPEVTDVDGHVITGGHAHLSGGKTIEAMQASSSVMGKELGFAWVTGRLTAYGVTLTDSVQVKFTPIPLATIAIDSTASGQPRSDMAGYKVWFPTNTPLPFSNNTSATITIVFAGPAPVPPEMTLPPGGSDFPMFATEGDYTWTVKSAPTVSGTITVMD